MAPDAALKELKKLRVADLKALLKQRGLDEGGLKDDLVRRLHDAQTADAGADAAGAADPPEEGARPRRLTRPQMRASANPPRRHSPRRISPTPRPIPPRAFPRRRRPMTPTPPPRPPPPRPPTPRLTRT